MKMRTRSKAMELFQQYTKLAYWCLNRFCKWYGVRHDDHENSALIGLWHAAVNYSEQVGAKFSTYAVKCCEVTLKSGFNRKQSPRRFVPTNNGIRMPEVTDNDGLLVVIDMIRKAITLREMKFLEDRYFGEMTFKQIGDRHGISRSRARQIVARAKEKARIGISEEEMEELIGDSNHSDMIVSRGRIPQNESATFENICKSYEESH